MRETIGACDLMRGVSRALTDADHSVLTELSLGNGRRADLIAIDRTGAIILVEVKSCRADFAADRKWQEYLAYCDRFYFAVGPDFPGFPAAGRGADPVRPLRRRDRPLGPDACAQPCAPQGDADPLRPRRREPPADPDRSAAGGPSPVAVRMLAR
jgi:hypothetical protein